MNLRCWSYVQGLKSQDDDSFAAMFKAVEALHPFAGNVQQYPFGAGVASEHLLSLSSVQLGRTSGSGVKQDVDAEHSGMPERSSTGSLIKACVCGILLLQVMFICHFQVHVVLLSCDCD